MTTNAMKETCYKAHAKCILAGEHAVLRGYSAVVLPLHDLQVSIKYQATDSALNADYVGAYGESMLLMFWGTLKKAFELINHDIEEKKGQLIIENNIPMCSGLGFSAALCIVIGRWFIDQGWLAEDKLFHFARELEDKFHQESSGVDIAGSISDDAVYYRRNNVPEYFKLRWQPKLYLSYTDHISVTAEAVKMVKHLFETEPLIAKRIDIDMAESALIAKEALCLQEDKGLSMLVDAMNKANDCFHQWQLVSEQLQNHITTLTKYGALAVKPTGAGIGGHVLSLWAEEPKSVPFELHRVL